MLHVTTESLDRLFADARQHCIAGHPDQARALCDELLRQHPRHAQAFFLLGCMAADAGNRRQAIQLFRRSLEINPNDAEGQYHLGRLLQLEGKPSEALQALQMAVRLSPASLEARNHLGVLLQDIGRYAEAVAIYQETLNLHPTEIAPLNNLGLIWQRLGKTDEAIATFHRLIAAHPDSAPAHLNLAAALNEVSRMDEAIAALHRAIELDPSLTPAWSSYLLALQYHPEYNARAIGDESRRFNDIHVLPRVQPMTRHANDPSPDRVLRIGYVSPDFADHVVGRFLVPLFEQHNSREFENYCYLVRAPIRDPISQILRSHSKKWHDVPTIDDASLAQLILSDQIDILVDLSMHTHGGRPLLFARKPAPVQVTYLAYAGTTGLTAIDYRLSDPFLDPPDADLSCYSEETLRLPRSYWCYSQPDTAPDPVLPGANRPVTFGCLNNFAKVSQPALQTWAALLASIADSRLILYCPPGNHRQNVLEIFQRQGVIADRIEFVVRSSFLDYLQHYQRIDIALDPFPYGGGATTCDALWMGLPVVTLRGDKPVARAGYSILSNAGLPQFVAASRQEYIQIAARLAADLPQRQSLRQTLRSQLLASSLMNAPAFARDIESAYRQMWRRWCQRKR